jgi:hypothetical protein
MPTLGTVAFDKNGENYTLVVDLNAVGNDLVLLCSLTAGTGDSARTSSITLSPQTIDGKTQATIHLPGPDEMCIGGCILIGAVPPILKCIRDSGGRGLGDIIKCVQAEGLPIHIAHCIHGCL